MWKVRISWEEATSAFHGSDSENDNSGGCLCGFERIANSVAHTSNMDCLGYARGRLGHANKQHTVVSRNRISSGPCFCRV